MGITWFIREANGIARYSHGGATNGQQAIFMFIPKRDFAHSNLALFYRTNPLPINLYQIQMHINLRLPFYGD